MRRHDLPPTAATMTAASPGRPTTSITVRSDELTYANPSLGGGGRSESGWADLCGCIQCGKHESRLRLIPNILNSPRQGSGTKKICSLDDSSATGWAGA